PILQLHPLQLHRHALLGHLLHFPLPLRQRRQADPYRLLSWPSASASPRPATPPGSSPMPRDSLTTAPIAKRPTPSTTASPASAMPDERSAAPWNRCESLENPLGLLLRWRSSDSGLLHRFRMVTIRTPYCDFNFFIFFSKLLFQMVGTVMTLDLT
ncbi:hypothetical protein LINPERPRIM_LOCUS14448, partial [Linum perenne]